MPQFPNGLLLRNRMNLFFGIGLQFISTMFLIRLVVITGLRMVYPFIPQLAAGLGLTVAGFSWLIFTRSMFGLTAPLFGLLADRYSRRSIMAAGLLAQGLGLAGIAFSRQWWSIGPIILLGIGATAFLPVQFAYISDLVAYERRGRAMATVDMSYAITGIILLPVVGWLIYSSGWRSPFLILALASLIAAAVIWFRFPTVEKQLQANLPWATMLGFALKPNVLASMAVGMLLLFAAACSMTIWGIWLSYDFGLDAPGLGLVATTISLAELGGIVLSALIIDRLGKRRGSQIGLLLTAVAFLTLPLSQNSLFLAVVMLVGLGGTLEFTTISLFSLYSEQLPQARAMMFSLVGLGMAIGMALGSPVTVVLWEQAGLWAVSAVSALGLLLALVLVWGVLKETAGPDRGIN